MKKSISIFILALLVTGCAQSGYKQFYTAYHDPKAEPEMVQLRAGEEPKVYGSDDFERDVAILRAKHHSVVGFSSFNGGYEDTKNAIKQAKDVGATIVLVKSEYTNTQTTTSPLFIPSSQTTHHSGSVYSGGNTGGYSGTSTTSGTAVVPITSHQRRYDQAAVYLVKFTHKMKLGVSYNDLTPEQRKALGRNTGARIDIVYEDTPAFYANIMVGDVLIAVDGNRVKNGQDANKLLESVPSNAARSELTVIRDGFERTIIVEFE